ncbi:MAG: glycosyltransferase [Deltaproteobacteria bacterium]|nr:glycosyltransferase [Deltaproteobacteria bacterium]
MTDSKLKEALGYSKFKGTPRIVLLDSGYLVVGDILDGAADLGWEIAVVPAKAKGKAEGDFLKLLLLTIVKQKPDFVITVNHLGFDNKGILAGMLNQYNIPVASWFVDNPVPILGGAVNSALQNIKLFCFEKTSLQWLKEKGFDEPLYLPTGSNTKYFNPGSFDKTLPGKFSHPLTFAGNSWWTKAIEEPATEIKKAAEEIRRKLNVNHLNFNDQYLSKFKKLKLKVKGDLKKYAALQVAFAKASLDTRIKFAKALNDQGLRVYGDYNWKKLVKDLDVRDFAAYKTELPVLFACSQININVTAEQMPTAVNQRVWDVPASGGFLITDYREDAVDFFKEDEEIVVYKNFEEAKDKVKYYLNHKEIADSIAKKAHEKVVKSHKITDRLQAMYKSMKKTFE